MVQSCATPLNADPLGGAIDHHSTLVLIAELALAVVGFAGVAAAFGGRDRAYLPIEKDRLRGLFSFSFSALATSLLALSLPELASTPADSTLWSAIVGAVLWVPVSGYFSWVASRNFRDPASSTTAGPLAIVFVGAIIPAALYAWSIALGGHPAFLELALSAQVLLAVWVFVRLLTHRT